MTSMRCRNLNEMSKTLQVVTSRTDLVCIGYRERICSVNAELQAPSVSMRPSRCYKLA